MRKKECGKGDARLRRTSCQIDMPCSPEKGEKEEENVTRKYCGRNMSLVKYINSRGADVYGPKW